jgi:hypothetical protein
MSPGGLDGDSMAKAPRQQKKGNRMTMQQTECARPATPDGRTRRRLPADLARRSARVSLLGARAELLTRLEPPGGASRNTERQLLR